VSFTGIPIEALDFYEGLEADNTKTYWAQHKATYDDAVRGPMRALCEALAPEFGDVHLYRPYRDLRFSRDKSPYKDHQGGTVGDHYLQISAAGLFAASGYYRMTSDQITRYRAAVGSDVSGPSLHSIVTRLRDDGYTVDGDRLKTRPRGFDADHPRIELLRHRSLVTWISFGAPPWLETPDVVRHVAAAWRDMMPLQTWLDDRVGPSAQPR
jgi:uncharacterized protein (TIGR02453 family)